MNWQLLSGCRSALSLTLAVFYYAWLVSAQQLPGTARVLIYSATLGYRHDSIPTAIQSLKNKSLSFNIEFNNTEDPTWFTDASLAQYDAVVFLSTTGQVLNATGQSAFQKYLDLGGNFIGIHSSSDTLVNTTFYGRELGAYFDYHPALQNATVDVIDPSHPSVSMLPAQWHVQDEMYNFKSDPRSLGAVVVLSANESSYQDPGPRTYNQGIPHPTAWYQIHGAGVQSGGTAGRSFYTSLGHLNQTWQDDLFMAHVFGGITWALQSNTTRAFNPNAVVGNPRLSSSGSSTSLTSTPTSTLHSASGSGKAYDVLVSAALSASAITLSAAFILYVL